MPVRLSRGRPGHGSECTGWLDRCPTWDMPAGLGHRSFAASSAVGAVVAAFAAESAVGVAARSVSAVAAPAVAAAARSAAAVAAPTAVVAVVQAGADAAAPVAASAAQSASGVVARARAGVVVAPTARPSKGRPWEWVSFGPWVRAVLDLAAPAANPVA